MSATCSIVRVGLCGEGMEVGFGVSMAIYVCLFIVATGPGLRRFRASPGSGRFHARCIDVPRIYEAPGNANGTVLA